MAVVNGGTGKSYLLSINGNIPWIKDCSVDSMCHIWKLTNSLQGAGILTDVHYIMYNSTHIYSEVLKVSLVLYIMQTY